MPVRTSGVVAIGLGLMTLIGVGTIFGDSIVALVAPPPIETVTSAADKGTGKASPVAPTAVSTTAPGAPRRADRDGGGNPAPDGSS